MFQKACNTTFDILDNKSDWAPGFKKAVCPENVVEIFEMMESLEKYFKKVSS